MTREPRFDELRDRLGEVEDLRKIRMLLIWDTETLMPPAGAAARAEQLGTIAQIAHERFITDEIGELLENLRPYEESLPYEDVDASIIRVTRRDYGRARRIPPELRAELARAGSLGLQAWHEAREANDYQLFRPALERNLELQQRLVDCFGEVDEPYDVLLDEREPGLTTADIDVVFGVLKSELVPLVSGLEPPNGTPLAVRADRSAVDALLDGLGFDRAWGRLDNSVHPFAASISSDDIRLTTYADDGLRTLYGVIHEFGHGLYEHGVDRALGRTPLAEGASYSIHESQSLLWENLVGRGAPFCRWLAALVGAGDPRELERALNRAERSLIRVDADPVTYSLHVIFRFELERDLVNDRLSPVDLREAWNARVAEYLQLEVPDDRRGVLQDIHWADGLMGYFPSYALGHVASVQIWGRAREDLPELEVQLERGEFAPLVDWLRDHVHAPGRKFQPVELLERVVGSGFDPQPLLRHLRSKVERAG